MNLLCKLGLHSYTIVHEGKYDLHGDPIGLPRVRGCTRCFKEQKLNKHLLGMNPVDYYESWETIKKGE